MKNFIENRCYEVIRRMDWCKYCKRGLLKAVEHIDVYDADVIVRKAIQFQNAKEQCEEIYTLVHMFIFATENEEYEQIWNDIVGKYEAKEWT